jgi:hypothetical protein
MNFREEAEKRHITHCSKVLDYLDELQARHDEKSNALIQYEQPVQPIEIDGVPNSLIIEAG